MSQGLPWLLPPGQQTDAQCQASGNTQTGDNLRPYFARVSTVGAWHNRRPQMDVGNSLLGLTDRVAVTDEQGDLLGRSRAMPLNLAPLANFNCKL